MRVNFLESLVLINSLGKIDKVSREDRLTLHEPNYWGIKEYREIQIKSNEKIINILGNSFYIVSEIYTKYKSDIPYFEIKNREGKKILAPALLFKKLVE
jgi:hypothetical protein